MNENETNQPIIEPKTANSTPNNTQPNTPVEPKKEGGLGATIASIIIILVIILGAFYFFDKLKDEQRQQNNKKAAQESQEDSVNFIEAEFEAENYDNIDKEMNQIEAEFEASAN